MTQFLFAGKRCKTKIKLCKLKTKSPQKNIDIYMNFQKKTQKERKLNFQTLDTICF